MTPETRAADQPAPAATVGRLGVWGHLDALRAGDAIAYAERLAALGYGCLWVPEVAGREPFALLGLLAGATRGDIALGTSIASIWARGPQAARMAALTLQEATGGRFVLGLGVSHAHMSRRLHGQEYERPLSRMRAYLAGYRAAVYRGPLHEPAPEPPVVLAALREKMLDLAATETQGAFPYLVTAERVAWMRTRLDAAATAAGRPRPLLAVTLPVALGEEAAATLAAARGYLAPYLRTPNYQASWALQGFEAADWEAPGSERLVDALVARGPAAAAAARIAALHAAGADHVALIPLTPEGGTEQLATLEVLAPR
ncbi:MAG TPA: LLM class flavin-dependent oxidoreductase [Candidatus Limnocylindrales bacterium]|nr:LLM class flavin-dependent oxidoreductase [Candidatus Limnocylindrales bacterium]